MDYPRGPNVITRIFLSERGKRVRVSKGDMITKAEVKMMPSLALKPEGATNQELPTVSRNWKGQGNRFPPKASRKNAALPTP